MRPKAKYAVIVQILDHRQIQHAFFGVDIRDISNPFCVRAICPKLTGKKIFVLVYLLSKIDPLSASTNL